MSPHPNVDVLHNLMYVVPDIHGSGHAHDLLPG